MYASRSSQRSLEITNNILPLLCALFILLFYHLIQNLHKINSSLSIHVILDVHESFNFKKAMEDSNLVISDGERRYKILQPIGTWGPDFSLIVYEALVLEAIDTNNNVPHVAFKMIKDNDELQDFHDMVVDDVNRSNEIVADGCRCILPILKSFYSEIDGDQTLCIVLPYDSQVISLRSLLSSNPRLTSGIHDKFIGIVLSRVLKALNKIHKKGNHHMQITAGNIFYNYQSNTIQLAYAASVYERDTTLNDGNVCSVNKMLAWGLAPEVKGDESLNFVHFYDTEKSDIWLVGILALELAYGQIPVHNRKELLEIASYINEVKILPNTWEELRLKSSELIAKKALPFKKRKSEEGSNSSIIPLSTEIREKRFSDYFGSLVATCLDTNVNKRASAKQLQQHVFLRKNVGSVPYFRDVIVKGINPHVVRFLSGN